MNDFWWLFSIFCSFASAGLILCNQILKANPTLVTIYRGFGIFCIVAPFCFLFKPIDNPIFYILCITQGFVLGFFENRLYSSAKKFGAGITGLMPPISIIFVFITWFIIHPYNFMEISQDTNRLLIIVSSLLMISFCVLKLTESKANKTALIYLIPCFFCIVALDIIGKKAMDIGGNDITSALYFYILITSFTTGILNLVSFIKQKNDIKIILNIKNFISIGLPIITVVLTHNILKNYSRFLAENPAYVAAVVYISPIWILLVNKYILNSETTKDYVTPNPKIIITLVISITALILAV